MQNRQMAGMQKTIDLYRGFEALIGELYVAEGFTVVERTPASRDGGYDFLLRGPHGESVGVEVKLYRTGLIARGRVIEMLRQAVGVKAVNKFDRMILVIGSKIGIPFADTYGVEVADLPKIMEMAGRHPDLLPKFEAFFRESSPTVTSADVFAAHVFGDAISSLEQPSNLITLTPEEHRRLGDRLSGRSRGIGLAKALRAVPPAREGAREFELKAQDALRYIFKDDLAGWSEQKVTRGGLSRYDVIARIASSHDFWRSLVVFFKSWYVVFEFKNNAKPITQKEVISTEKYLYEGALRMVAFIVSREGAAPNALETARGALREHGKLIVNLSVEDVCTMLRLKDSVKDPNAFLHDILDGMLMRLQR